MYNDTPRTLFAPAVAGTLLAVVLACSGTPTDNGGTASTDNAKSVVPAAKIGTKVRDGKFEFVVSKNDCTKTRVGTREVGQDAQGKFCLVTVTITNIGKEAQLFDASSQKATDAKDATFDADSGAGIYANDNVADTFLNNINPGNQVKGVIVFDVPKATTLTSVELHDSPFSDGVKVLLK